MNKSLSCLAFLLLMCMNLFVSSAQEMDNNELFQSVKQQKTDALNEYLYSKSDLDIVDEDGEGLVYHSLNSWNLPALALLLEKGAPFNEREMTRLLRRKLQMDNGMQITPENQKSHTRVVDYIEPFQEYTVVRGKEGEMENYQPELLPPSYKDLRQILSRAKLQYDILAFRTINSGFENDLGSSGFSAGAGVNIPLFKNYESRIITGDPDVRVSDTPQGKKIYFDEAVFMMEQLQMKQYLKQRFSMYLNIMLNYSKRKAGELPGSSELFSSITNEDYFLDMRFLDVSPSLLFKYGSVYLKTGLELRKNLSTEINWPADAADDELNTQQIEENIIPVSTSFTVGIGVELQWVYVELCRSLVSSDAFKDTSSSLNWLGLNLGIRL